MKGRDRAAGAGHPPNAKDVCLDGRGLPKLRTADTKERDAQGPSQGDCGLTGASPTRKGAYEYKWSPLPQGKEQDGPPPR